MRRGDGKLQLFTFWLGRLCSVYYIEDFVCSSRKQTSEALKKFHDLKSQAKLWATQTRLTGQTEVKILLSKVDAYLQHLILAEKTLLEHQNHIKSLELEKEQMFAQLNKTSAEKSKDQGKNAELNALVRSTQDQVDTLTNQMKAKNIIKT